MSTITKLDPHMRVKRTERRNLQRYFMRQADIRTALGKLCIDAFTRLIQLRRDPRFTGDQKHELALKWSAKHDALLIVESAENPQRPTSDFVRASTPVTGIGSVAETEVK